MTLLSNLAFLLLGTELVARWVARQDPVVSTYEIYGHPEGKVNLNEHYQEIAASTFHRKTNEPLVLDPRAGNLVAYRSTHKNLSFTDIER